MLNDHCTVTRCPAPGPGGAAARPRWAGASPGPLVTDSARPAGHLSWAGALERATIGPGHSLSPSLDACQL
eukprot:410190-Hanusia_phi.AAC.1